LIGRTQLVIDGLVEPLVDALQQAETLFRIESHNDASAAESVMPSAIALALARRERELADQVAALGRHIREQMDAVRRAAAVPVESLSPEDQFRYWLQETQFAPGRRERFQFTPERAVEISRDFVQAHSEVLEQLVLGFAAMAEDAAVEAEGAPQTEPIDGVRPERPMSLFAQEPSWKVLLHVPDLPLTVDEGLVLVAIGTELGLWEPTPPVSQLAEFGDELDLDDVPFLSPSPKLLGVVHV